MSFIIVGIVAFIIVLFLVFRLPRPQAVGKKPPVCPPADNTDIKIKDVLRHAKVIPYVDDAVN